MKYFVCADIHGFFDEWMQALKEQGFEINNPQHKIIVCGDLFDRGRQPKKIIDFILENKNQIILVRGNHEDLMQEAIKRNGFVYVDIPNGTMQTTIDLSIDYDIANIDLLTIAKVSKLDAVMSLCIDYYETEHYVFVHGWIPIDEYELKYDPNWRMASINQFANARWQNPLKMVELSIFEPNKTIVCGHWHCSAFWHMKDPIKFDEFGERSCFKPFITKEYMAIDGCTAYSGIVNVVVIEDNELA